MEKGAWSIAPVLQMVKKFQENIALSYIYQLTQFGGLVGCGSPCLMN